MPHLSPQTGFLLRGSALVIGFLLLWWLLLSAPMVAVLRATVETTGGLFFGGRSSDLMRETAAGDWTFHVPMEATVPATAAQPASRIDSVDFDLARKDVTGFTFSLPIYWAIFLAAPGLRRNLRALVVGSVLMAAIEILLLLLLVEINARNTLAQLTETQSAAGKWLLHLGEYLVVTVLPYAAPFVVAVTVHGEMRHQMLGWGGGQATAKHEEVSRKGREDSKVRRKDG